MSNSPDPHRPDETRPALSVIVIGYNMARELPRTIKSLSASMQRDILANDYELILLDNGSTERLDHDQLLALAPNLTIHNMAPGDVSPVGAVNHGIELARGDLVGVCIDGARIASPGLLSAALRAAKLHPRPVIGTLSFHLGTEVQPKSILKGYNQDVEDALLESIGWEQNGYHLFDISVFAGSAAGGWFRTPAETNALFMRAEHWKELGGFDKRFVSPGGGLANLDTWKRACEDPTGELIMLLGEATFHQVHGGVATNATVSPKQSFRAEYERIRGIPHEWPQREATYFGAFSPEARATLHQR